MKACVLKAFGDVSNFEMQEIAKPVVKPGYVLVKVAATSINPVDYKTRSAFRPFSPELPGVLGLDVAGTVEAVGEGVSGFKIGDEVYGCAGGIKGEGGADAEYLLADADFLAPKPAGLSMVEAAALPLVTITAWEGLFDRARISAGQTVLIHGGAGGVGHIAVQLAKAQGAKVFATVSSEHKAEIARGFGADETINYREEAVEAYVARLTGGRGFDVVFDTTGGSDLATSFAGARLNGQVITIVSTYEADLAPMHGKGLSLHVVFMLIPLIHGHGRARHGEILREAGKLVAAGKLKPLLDSAQFPLEQLPQAHQRLESGQAIGKVVVTVD